MGVGKEWRRNTSFPFWNFISLNISQNNVVLVNVLFAFDFCLSISVTVNKFTILILMTSVQVAG